MNNRIVKLFYPYRPKNNLIKNSISKVPVSKKYFTIYDTVNYFLDSIFLKQKNKVSITKISNRILLGSIINLHNKDGVRLPTIKSMIKQINSGKDIFHDNGLPNSKLIKSKEGKWVLFDGHHTMLAYMFNGRKYLHEIPHLIVEDGKKEYVTDKEISVFFGKHASKLKDGNWRKYTINWETDKEKQLCKRKQKNMRELFEVLCDEFSNYL